MTRAARLFFCLIAVASVLAEGAPANGAQFSTVPVPRVSGPVTGGLRGMWGESIVDPASLGYTEQEYFISGNAKSFGGPNPLPPPGLPQPWVAPAGSHADYTTRIIVRRPADPKRFNGSVLVEWINTTGQNDNEFMWADAHPYLTDAGFVSVGVSVQRQGVDGSPLPVAGNPTGLKYYDPVRYGSLNHPGDEYSYDIFSQAAQALRTNGKGSVDPLRGLKVKRVLATGISQSNFMLVTYLEIAAREARVIDGFAPIVFGVSDQKNLQDDTTQWIGPVPTDVAPTLVINSESESAVPPPDEGLFRYWEVAGTSHVGHWADSWNSDTKNRDLAGIAPTWNAETAGQYGEQTGGECPDNYFPAHYAYRAAFAHLDHWVRTGTPPPAATPFERNAAGEYIRDADGNIMGGVRLPPIDVPVATYTGDACGLMGSTTKFDDAELARRYPTHASYVTAMREATEASVAAGFLLTDDAADLMARVEASPIGS